MATALRKGADTYHTMALANMAYCYGQFGNVDDSEEPD